MIFGAGSYATSEDASGNRITTPALPVAPVVETILDYYAALLILQYRIKAKAKATIRLAANQNLCNGFIFDEAGCFDLDTATGVQLDVLGRIVGVSRKIYTFDLTKQYFNFTSYAGAPAIIHGFGKYADSPYDAGGNLFYRYLMKNAISVSLADEDMRTLIRMKIELNNSPATFAFIKYLVFKYLSTDVTVQDSLDMTLTYTIKTTFGTIARAALFLGMLPTPAGVQPNYVFV